MLREAEALLQHVLSEHPNHARARRLLKSVDGSYTMVYDERTQREREKRDAVLDTPISDFELSVRSRNCLRQMNIRTLGDLLRTTEAELLSYKNFGETSLNEIKAMLTQRGLRLGQTLQPVAQPATPQLTSLPPGSSPHINRPVTELELSVRSRKALQRLGVTTLGELAMRSEPELLAIKNFGQTSLTEIKRQLETFGLTLRDSE
jgi:DNA-directed RNA polymerase subunit alpha